MAIWQVAEYAVGQHRGSANPGEGDNIVLAGHVGGFGQPPLGCRSAGRARRVSSLTARRACDVSVIAPRLFDDNPHSRRRYSN
jgi:hypothetical protein